MVDIAKHFKWNYVSTLADEGNYGERGISAFEERAKKSGNNFFDFRRPLSYKCLVCLEALCNIKSNKVIYIHYGQKI